MVHDSMFVGIEAADAEPELPCTTSDLAYY